MSLKYMPEKEVWADDSLLIIYYDHPPYGSEGSGILDKSELNGSSDSYSLLTSSPLPNQSSKTAMSISVKNCTARVGLVSLSMGLKMSERDRSVMMWKRHVLMIGFHILKNHLPVRSWDAKIDSHGSGFLGRRVRLTTEATVRILQIKFLLKFAVSAISSVQIKTFF